MWMQQTTLHVHIALCICCYLVVSFVEHSNGKADLLLDITAVLEK